MEGLPCWIFSSHGLIIRLQVLNHDLPVFSSMLLTSLAITWYAMASVHEPCEGSRHFIETKNHVVPRCSRFRSGSWKDDFTVSLKLLHMSFQQLKSNFIHYSSGGSQISNNSIVCFVPKWNLSHNLCTLINYQKAMNFFWSQWPQSTKNDDVWQYFFQKLSKKPNFYWISIDFTVNWKSAYRIPRLFYDFLSISKVLQVVDVNFILVHCVAPLDTTKFWPYSNFLHEQQNNLS